LGAGNPLFLAVDHAPIVVNDLESIQNMLKQDLNFTVKDGKAHEGIQNCFIKFGDGTYLEFIQPLDSLAAIGKYYSNFLKTRQGGATFAISVSNTEQLKDQLNQKNIPFMHDQNKIWQTVEPVSEDFFFIEYANKSWKDSPSNWTHLNTAKGLSAVYILSKNFQADLKKYLLLGFIEKEKGKIFETPYRKLKVGQNELILLDANKSKNKNSLLNLNNVTGICGFNIRVNSLQMFNQSLKQKLGLEIEKNRTVVYLSSYNLFLIFEE
jgi:Glyoxalase-like domain